MKSYGVKIHKSYLETASGGAVIHVRFSRRTFNNKSKSTLQRFPFRFYEEQLFPFARSHYNSYLLLYSVRRDYSNLIFISACDKE